MDGWMEWLVYGWTEVEESGDFYCNYDTHSPISRTFYHNVRLPPSLSGSVSVFLPPFPVYNNIFNPLVSWPEPIKCTLTTSTEELISHSLSSILNYHLELPFKFKFQTSNFLYLQLNCNYF